jgi:hypothetical protein
MYWIDLCRSFPYKVPFKLSWPFSSIWQTRLNLCAVVPGLCENRWQGSQRRQFHLVRLDSSGVSSLSFSLRYIATFLTFIRFAAFMLIGAVITKGLVPNPVDIWGHSRSLEDLGRGKAERKRLEREEAEHWRTFAPRSPTQ